MNEVQKMGETNGLNAIIERIIEIFRKVKLRICKCDTDI